MNARAAWIGIVSVALVGCASVSPQEKKEAAARMQMGVTFIEQRNLPSAMRELTKASELDPENPEIDLALGLAYQARGDLGKAEENFRAAIRKKKDYAEAHNNLGIVLGGLGRGEEAIREFETAASDIMYATPERAYYNIGEEYRKRKEFAKADEMYRRAITMNNRYVDAYQRLALLQGDAKRWAEAARTLEVCVALEPTYAPGWMDLGRVYVVMKRTGDALGAFQNALANSTDPVLRKQASDSVESLSRGRK